MAGKNPLVKVDTSLGRFCDVEGCARRRWATVTVVYKTATVEVRRDMDLCAQHKHELDGGRAAISVVKNAIYYSEVVAE